MLCWVGERRGGGEKLPRTVEIKIFLMYAALQDTRQEEEGGGPDTKPRPPTNTSTTVGDNYIFSVTASSTSSHRQQRRIDWPSTGGLRKNHTQPKQPLILTKQPQKVPGQPHSIAIQSQSKANFSKTFSQTLETKHLPTETKTFLMRQKVLPPPPQTLKNTIQIKPKHTASQSPFSPPSALSAPMQTSSSSAALIAAAGSQSHSGLIEPYSTCDIQIVSSDSSTDSAYQVRLISDSTSCRP